MASGSEAKKPMFGMWWCGLCLMMMLEEGWWWCGLCLMMMLEEGWWWCGLCLMMMLEEGWWWCGLCLMMMLEEGDDDDVMREEEDLRSVIYSSSGSYVGKEQRINTKNFWSVFSLTYTDKYERTRTLRSKNLWIFSICRSWMEMWIYNLSS